MVDAEGDCKEGIARRAGNRRHAMLAVGGVLGAVLASSCCVLPLALALLGVSGAWIGRLTVLEPYRAWIIAGTMILLAVGLWRVYSRVPQDCVDGSHCARRKSLVLTKGLLWISAALVLLAASVDYWATMFY